jgi:hypothetical protein
MLNVVGEHCAGTAEEKCAKASVTDRRKGLNALRLWFRHSCSTSPAGPARYTARQLAIRARCFLGYRARHVCAGVEDRNLYRPDLPLDLLDQANKDASHQGVGTERPHPAATYLDRGDRSCSPCCAPANYAGVVIRAFETTCDGRSGAVAGPGDSRDASSMFRVVQGGARRSFDRAQFEALEDPRRLRELAPILGANTHTVTVERH